MKRTHLRFFVAFTLVLFIGGAILLKNNREAGRAELQANVVKCKASGPERRACFNSLIMDAARARGVAAGLDTLTDVYAIEPDFAEDCHPITHDIGALSYETFKAGKDFSLSIKASSCGFGFYHGFMEAMLAANGDLTEAKRFCEYVDSKMKSNSGNVSAACYHGIGHGVVDGADESKWGNESTFIERGLALCAQLGKIDPDQEHLTRCASGVFNSLAIGYLSPKYRLTPNSKDPYAICRKQIQTYEKTACYDQMNGYISRSNKNFSDALRVVGASAETEYRTVAIQSLATSEASIYLTARIAKDKNAPTAELKECAAAMSEMRSVCAKGFGVGLVEAGDPTHGYENAAAVCSKDPEFSADCYAGVSQAAHDWAPPSRQKTACAAIRTFDDTSGDACESLMRTGRGG